MNVSVPTGAATTTVVVGALVAVVPPFGFGTVVAAPPFTEIEIDAVLGLMKSGWRPPAADRTDARAAIARDRATLAEPELVGQVITNVALPICAEDGAGVAVAAETGAVVAGETAGGLDPPPPPHPAMRPIDAKAPKAALVRAMESENIR